CKKNLINEKLTQIYYEDTYNPHTSIQITIKNLKFSKLDPVSEKYRRRYSWYFVCVLQSGTKVIASKVVEPEAIEINFPDYFQFEGHTHDLKIDVSLYALVLKNNIKKKNKNSQKMTTSQLTDCAPTHSFFTLWGKTQMKPCQITRRSQNVLALSKVPAEASISNAFTADVETRLKINITMKGFLTIGTDFKGCPVWNRRWCVLEGSRIKYWNHPNEETLMAPIGQLDLLNTLTHQVELVDKEFCPRPRTLSLEVRVEGPGPAIREYFLSADSWSEFEEWSRQLNLVLGYLRKWENIVCYLDN
ncbi:Anillin, partial [Gonioctena quinquepunctata]